METLRVAAVLQQISDRVRSLDPALRERATALLVQSEFGATPSGPPSVSKAVAPRSPGQPAPQPSPSATFDQLVESWRPASQADWALLGAYFKSESEGEKEFSSQDVNTILKNHGFGIANITRTFGNLTATSPQLLLQVRKSGTSQQARKTYKITTQGVRTVQAHLQGSGTSP